MDRFDRYGGDRDRGANERFVASSGDRSYNRHYDDEYLVHESTAVRDTRDREQQPRDREWIERERYQPLAPHQSSSPHRSGGNNRRVLNAM